MFETASPQLAPDVRELCRAVFGDRRPIVVSNRGPIEHRIDKDGKLEARRGSGGVVTALSGIMEFNPVIWIACAITDGDRYTAEMFSARDGETSHSTDNGARLHLVVPPQEIFDRHYKVFSNPILWLLQHSLWNRLSKDGLARRIREGWHGGYLPVNRRFAQATLSALRSDDAAPCVLFHDYHLYAAPAYVRDQAPEATLTHFIHIPWPEPDIWENLPQDIVETIVRSLLANDIIGFQTNRSLENFLWTCYYFAKGVQIDFDSARVLHAERQTSLRTYPISVNVNDLRERMRSPEVQSYKERLLPLCEEFTIVRVDRLDLSKNILAGFQAFDLLLQRQPELIGRVKFLAFLVPSRTDIPEYQNYAAKVFHNIDRINNRYGQSGWRPIEVFYENNYSQALAGLSLYDALLVNSVADGMNLVAKEGAIVNERDGLLLLTRTAGAYEELGDAAVTIDDPEDIEATADAMSLAISLPQWVRRSRAERLQRIVEERDISLWLWSQLKDLHDLVTVRHPYVATRQPSLGP